MDKPHITKLPEISPSNPLFWQITPPNSASPCSDRVVRFFARKDDEGGSSQRNQDQRLDQSRKPKESQIRQQSSTGRSQITISYVGAVRQHVSVSSRPPEVLNRLQEVACRAQEVVTNKAQELAIRLQGVTVGRPQDIDSFKHRYHREAERRRNNAPEQRRESVSSVTRPPTQQEVLDRLQELADRTRPGSSSVKCDSSDKVREASIIRREISTGEPPPLSHKSSLKRREVTSEKVREDVKVQEVAKSSRESSEERPPFPLVPDIRTESNNGIQDLLTAFRPISTQAATRQIDLISVFDTELDEPSSDKGFTRPTQVTFHRDSISLGGQVPSTSVSVTSSPHQALDDLTETLPRTHPPTIRINPPPPSSTQYVDVSLVDINDDDDEPVSSKSGQGEKPVPPPIPARTRVGSVRSRPPLPPPRPQSQACGSSTSTSSTSSSGTSTSGTGRKTPPPAYSELYPGRRYSSERLGPPPRPSPPGRKLSEGCLPSNRQNSSGTAPLRPSPLEAAARTVDQPSDPNTSPITKSHSTPASLQTIVRFHSGSTMSLHHKILGERGSGTHYLTRGKLRYQFIQIAINAIAILAIGAALAAYFKAYPGTTVRYVNRNVTVTTTKVAFIPQEVNPAPGMCLSVIVPFCIQHKIPYNFTIFPNYFAHLNQREAIQELEPYDALVDVRCYELSPLFICSVFVPKCGPDGEIVHPCRSLCQETKRRCGFFLEVFGLTLTDYLGCDLFPESEDPDVCIGHWEVIMAERKAQRPACTSGFQCDVKRCIPWDWRCDGHIDCEDQSDELNCIHCSKGMIHCGENKCIAQSHMCDGITDCPWSQDERNCMRLSERMGDEGSGKLEVYQPELQSWRPACISSWDPQTSPQTICSLLGYGSNNESSLARKGSKLPVVSSLKTEVWRKYTKIKKSMNLLRQLRSCQKNEPYTTVDLTCTNVTCGVRRQTGSMPSRRIIGGKKSTPGDWPFLAALLGGPEQIFYCAGVLISDQWVLTASHCVGNVSQSELSGWTIQLGITRRRAHSYLGQKAKVKRVIPHPMYNIGVAHDNDIALFQLSQRVTFHEHLLPVCLPAADYHLAPGTMCTVIGWGKREDTLVTEYEAGINEVTVPVLNRTVCNKWLEPRELNITQGMICAGYEAGGKDACQGDSGGPLLCQTPGVPERWFVGGIVSWGIKCAHPRLPGVYAYVPHYLPWIKQQIAQYSD